MKDLLNLAIHASIDAGDAILEVYNSNDFDVEIKGDNSPLTKADRNAHLVIMDKLKNTGIPVLSEEGKSIPYSERKDWNQFWLVDPLDGTKEFIKRNGEFTVNIAMIENEKAVAGVVYVPVTDTLYYGSIELGAFIYHGAKEAFQKEDKIDWFAIGKKIPITNNSDAYRVVASRSHMSPETEDFVAELKKNHDKIEIVSKGSSLKLCLIAEGEADIYPRFGPTSEWDTAAGHAVINASGGIVVLAENQDNELKYNKENILNPYFIAKR